MNQACGGKKLNLRNRPEPDHAGLRDQDKVFGFLFSIWRMALQRRGQVLDPLQEEKSELKLQKG